MLTLNPKIPEIGQAIKRIKKPNKLHNKLFLSLCSIKDKNKIKYPNKNGSEKLRGVKNHIPKIFTFEERREKKTIEIIAAQNFLVTLKTKKNNNKAERLAKNAGKNW